MKKPLRNKILLVEDNLEIVEILQLRLEMHFDAKVVVCKSGNEAIEELKKSTGFICVLSDYHMRNGNGGKIFNYMNEKGLGIPFFLMSSSPAYEYPEFRDKKVTGYFVKPNLESIEDEIVKALGNDYLNSNPYVKVPLRILERVGELPFDCRLKIDEKFIVILDKNTKFEAKDYKKYSKRGIFSFLVEREESKQLLEILQMTMLNDDPQDVDSMIDIIGTTLEIAKSIIGTEGLGAEIIEAIERSAKSLSDMITLDTKLASYLQRLEFHEDDYLGQHSSLLAYVSCMIANQMTWESDYTQVKLTFAALLHDMSLTDEEIKNHDYYLESSKDPEMKEDELIQSYKKHPIRAIELLKDFTSVPTTVDQIILQHHELPDGSGFPAGLTAKRIAPLSCVFIVGEDFTDYVIQQKQSGKSINYKQYISLSANKFSEGNFKEVFHALVNVLTQKEKKDKAA